MKSNEDSIWNTLSKNSNFKIDVWTSFIKSFDLSQSIIAINNF